jgi:hypothetical protein
LPAASNATGTNVVIATPPIEVCASVYVVHAVALAGFTATCTFCCGDGVVVTGSWYVHDTAIVPSAPTATLGVVENPPAPYTVIGAPQRPPA